MKKKATHDLVTGVGISRGVVSKDSGRRLLNHQASHKDISKLSFVSQSKSVVPTRALSRLQGEQ